MKRVSELKGRELEYWVAMADGYVWARNNSNRSGDSYRNAGQPPRWPIGGRCVIEPGHASGLNETNPNWDGWFKAEMTDPIAPAWDHTIPSYLSGHGALRILMKAKITVWDAKTLGHEHNFGAYIHPTPSRRECDNWGDTYLEAALRTFVESIFGPEVSDE